MYNTSVHTLGLDTIPFSVLLVEGHAADTAAIQEALANPTDSGIRVVAVTRLDEALRQLKQKPFSVVLLDLFLPDSQGLETFEHLFQAAPDALILILSDADHEPATRQALRRGAHDFLIKSRIDSYWLPRTLHGLVRHKTVRDELLNSEERFHALSDVSPLGIFVSDEQGNCVYTNAAYHKITGLALEQTLGTQWSSAIHPEDRDAVLAQWHTAVSRHEPFTIEFRFLRADQSIVWARVKGAGMRAGRKRYQYMQTVEDISAQKSVAVVLQAAEDALFEEKERAQVTLNSIGDAVLTTDLRGNITYLNQVAESMTGWSLQDALGRPLSEVFRVIDGVTHQTALNPAQRAIDEDRSVGMATDSVLVRRDGSEAAIEDSSAPIHNREGEVTGAVIVFHDVSQSRAMALKMSHLAQHDFLTGLPNRMLLTERLSQAIGLAHRHHKQVALLFLDLDYFKHINDSLGHAIGDQLLQSVAHRLTACVRSTDTVCRQGGDEFVILLAEIEEPEAAAVVAEKLLAALGVPQHIGGHELHVTLSIGISIYPDDGSDVDTVIQNADTAMYHAKANGRNNYQFFRADMNARAVRRQFVESSLRRALRQGEFVLHYQPKINLSSGAITGTEALIRWHDPELGLIYPEQFVLIAEECGLIVPIGQWVLREACTQVQAWLDAGLQAVPVAVNISAVEFRHEGFLAGVELILKETGLAPYYLELELTETILMHNAAASAKVLQALKAMGVRLALDDFGTGYSSLSYLKQFPIDTLKIDQSFLRDIATGSDDATILSAVIGMGRNLKQRVIAEGVETNEQLAFLRTQQCDEGQGFQFSHPLPAEDFASLLVSSNGYLRRKCRVKNL